MHLGCAIISDGARSRPSELDCVCGSTFTAETSRHAFFAWLLLHFCQPAQSRLGYSALFGTLTDRERERGWPKGNASECGMYEKYETWDPHSGQYKSISIKLRGG